eukprot:632529-Pelagomonas_calceolata.AAC.3
MPPQQPSYTFYNLPAPITVGNYNTSTVACAPPLHLPMAVPFPNASQNQNFPPHTMMQYEQGMQQQGLLQQHQQQHQQQQQQQQLQQHFNQTAMAFPSPFGVPANHCSTHPSYYDGLTGHSNMCQQLQQPNANAYQGSSHQQPQLHPAVQISFPPPQLPEHQGDTAGPASTIDTRLHAVRELPLVFHPLYTAFK